MFFLITVLLYIGAGATETKNDTLSCIANITKLNEPNKVVNFTTDCIDRPCIPKCCRENEVIFFHIIKQLKKNEITCVNASNFKNMTFPLDYSNLTIYESEIESGLRPTKKKFLQDFTLVQNKVLLNEKCGIKWFTAFKGYLLENGNFAGDMNNQQGIGWRIKEPQKYCVDRTVFKMMNRYKSDFSFFVAKEKPADTTARLNFTGAGLLISSFFLLLVLMVYWMLPPLRNLSGMLLMSYVTMLLLVYLMKAFYIFTPNMHYKTCANIFSPLLYFLFVSSILWLNIMSFDIWWTFRGMRLSRAINRRGELVKFLWYGLYAWGVALAMTIGVVIVDKVDLSRWPKVIKPSFDTCLAVEDANLRYMYIPIAILTVVNIVLFLMTLYNIWLTGKILNDFKSSSNSTKNKSRFRLYIKMSLVMGISWALEVAQSFYKESDIPTWLYVVINLYNTLIGIPIFILFIFNRNTFVLLCKRFKIQSKYAQDANLNSSTRSTVSRSRFSNKGSSIKARNTADSDIEIFETEVSTNPGNNIDQIKQTHF